MSKPDWFRGIQEFCRTASIEIMGWGTDTLLVKAESQERAEEVASQLRSFGFEAIHDEADAEAGMLLLSRNRAATIAQQHK
jgi:hypothetical protein